MPRIGVYPLLQSAPGPLRLASVSDNRQSEKLFSEQLKRQVIEQELADVTEDEKEAAQHQRRAEKAEYLRRKLEQRAKSERRDRS